MLMSEYERERRFLDRQEDSEWRCYGKCMFFTYSNCRAAILLGKPVTKQVISHGRSVSLDVRTAPPFDSPLCCLRRRGGLGVEPM